MERINHIFPVFLFKRLEIKMIRHQMERRVTVYMKKMEEIRWGYLH